MRWRDEGQLDKDRMETIFRNDAFRMQVPEQLHDGLFMWAFHGIQPGDFLVAVLRNDLFEACGRADLDCQRHLWDIVNFIYNEMPAGCRGSLDHLVAWKDQGGILKIFNIEA